MAFHEEARGVATLYFHPHHSVRVLCLLRAIGVLVLAAAATCLSTCTCANRRWARRLRQSPELGFGLSCFATAPPIPGRSRAPGRGAWAWPGFVATDHCGGGRQSCNLRLRKETNYQCLVDRVSRKSFFRPRPFRAFVPRNPMEIAQSRSLIYKCAGAARLKEQWRIRGR